MHRLIGRISMEAIPMDYFSAQRAYCREYCKTKRCIYGSASHTVACRPGVCSTMRIAVLNIGISLHVLKIQIIYPFTPDD